MAEQQQGGAAVLESPNASPAAAEPEAGPRISARARLILLAILVTLLAAGGAWYLRYSAYGKYQQSTNDAFIQSDAVVVSSKVGGFVEQVLVRENQAVKAGDPLLQIDARDYRAQTAQYEAQVGVANANADGIRAQIAEQHAAIDRARGELAAAQSAQVFAQTQVDRYAPLAASGAETNEKLSQLRDEARQAEAKVVTAKAALVSAERRVDTLETQIGQAQAQGRAAQAQVAAANVNLNSTLVRASIDGRVGDKSVQPGQFVQPGLRLMSIVPVQNLYVEANFKETQVGLMRIGQPVTVAVDALDGVQLAGKVDSFSPGTGAQFSLLPPQNATGNFTKIVQRVPVRIAIAAGPETRALLLPGMSVSVSVDTRSAKGARERIEQEQKLLDKSGK
jgi:membrane fusion protein (multidrug efflux system)